MAFSVLEELERKAVLREGGHRQRTRRGSSAGDQDSRPTPRTENRWASGIKPASPMAQLLEMDVKGHKQNGLLN